MNADDDLITQVRRKMDPGAVGRPVLLQAIEQAERSLLFSLPPLLKRLYMEVGEGGFGPGYGFLGLLEDERGDALESVVGLYLAFRQGDPMDPSWAWPDRLLPICDWGCAVRSCVDCSRPEAPISVFDPGAHQPGEPMDRALLTTHASIHAFLLDWISNVDIWHQMFEPDPTRTVGFRNPFTGQDTSLTPRKLRR